MTTALKVLSPVPARERGTPPEDGGGHLAPIERERETLLELLAQQQRVAQVGLMTSGLTHDLLNHLQVLMSETQLALGCDDPHEWREALGRVQEVCGAMAETTRAFLGFVKRRRATWDETFKLSSAVEESQRLTARLAAHEGVELSLAIGGDALVCGERNLIVQALVNLISNAIKACAPGSGQVVVRTSALPDSHVRVEVSDNGPGIPAEVRQRLFRPFATSRRSGEGSGLGLFIVRQAVRKLGGRLRLSTSRGGTTIRVDLPDADAG